MASSPFSSSGASGPAIGARGLPLVVGVEMGYGHLRAASALATELGMPLLEADAAGVADAAERRLWSAAREIYERASRGTDLPMLGAAARSLLDSLTGIQPLHPYRDQSTPTRHALALDRLLALGLGAGLGARALESHRGVLTTFFAAAHAVERRGCDRVDLVVTDADISRAWVPCRPDRSRIRYFVPSLRARRRLLAYGVAPTRIFVSGFPLPPELVGDDSRDRLRANLAARLARLDPQGRLRRTHAAEIEPLGAPPARSRPQGPVHLVYAVGGAGAQAEIARAFLPSLAPLVVGGRLRLTLVAGTRPDVAERFARWLDQVGLAGSERASILLEPRFAAYYKAFNALLATADVLWTKPSELTFYGALGIPLILSEPVGVHESYNRRWARERGAALKQRDPRHAGQWLMEWLEEGVLGACALAGHGSMPADGALVIARALAGR